MNENKYQCESLRKVLESYPLYKKERINSEFANNPLILEGFGFPFYCICQKTSQTHLLKFEGKTLNEMEVHASHLNFPSSRNSKYAEYKIDGEIGQKFTEKVYGECQSCKRKQAVFLIEFFTEKHGENEYYFYAKKVGQDPPFSIKIDAYIRKSLNGVNLDLYQKALKNLSSNYGIGAFAYFRRIIETELISLLVEVSKLNTPGSDQIKLLLEKHKTHHVIPDLLEEVYKYLPESLKGLGVNPFKLLYGAGSVGIHQLTDDECFEKATSLKSVLEFVLKKIYEEKNEVSLVRDHIKNLM